MQNWEAIESGHRAATASILRRGLLPVAIALAAIGSLNTRKVAAAEPGPVVSAEASLLERLRNGAGSPQSQPNSTLQTETAPPPSIDQSETAAILQEAANLAAQAERMAQTSTTAADWDQVMAQWLSAIALAQSIPPESPSRIVAQRRLRRYLEQLLDAQQRAEQASPTAQVPSFGSELFDAQLLGYLSYLATEGTPDVLIVGSSRALQGVDPQVLQAELAKQGLGESNVFNFSVNGATAQVVDFIVSDLLPGEMPGVIVWGDGSRAFNEGRRDRTWESLVSSPGYQTLASGEIPSALLVSTASTSDGWKANAGARQTVTAHSPIEGISATLDDLGFSAVSDRFNPSSYYRQFPRVLGQYDGAYSPFLLEGKQTAAFGRIAASTAQQGSELIFVNLPLSDSYLDEFRLYYEGQFQQFLQIYGQAYGVAVIDLLRLWNGQPEFFADPSHINQYGAAAIAAQLAQSPTLQAALYRSAASEQ